LSRKAQRREERKVGVVSKMGVNQVNQDIITNDMMNNCESIHSNLLDPPHNHLKLNSIQLMQLYHNQYPNDGRRRHLKEERIF